MVRIGREFSMAPVEVLRMMGFDERHCKAEQWQYVAILDVMAAEAAIKQFENEKAKQKSKRGRRR